MRVPTIALLVCISTLAIATCSKRRDPNYTCLKQEDAQQVADNFQNLISEYSDAIADNSMTADFEYYCDSTIELSNGGCSTPFTVGSLVSKSRNARKLTKQQLGEAPFSSRAEYKKGQGIQPLVHIRILRMWHSCTEVFMYWELPTPPEKVRGVTVLEAERATEGAPFPWVTKRAFSEYNSGAWLVNLGLFEPKCNATARSKGR